MMGEPGVRDGFTFGQPREVPDAVERELTHE